MPALVRYEAPIQIEETGETKQTLRYMPLARKRVVDGLKGVPHGAIAENDMRKRMRDYEEERPERRTKRHTRSRRAAEELLAIAAFKKHNAAIVKMAYKLLNVLLKGDNLKQAFKSEDRTGVKSRTAKQGARPPVQRVNTFKMLLATCSE